MQSARRHEPGKAMCKFVVIQTVKSDFSSRARPACRAELATNRPEAQAAAAGWNLGIFHSALQPEARGFSAGISQSKGRSVSCRERSCQTPSGSRAGTGQWPQPQEPFPGQAGREAQQLHFGKSHQAQVEVTT